MSSTRPRILMCPPTHYGIEYEINPWMDRRIGSDSAAALRQWDGLRSKLEDLGAVIELLDPIPGLPDLVFTANAGLVFGDRFISSRFRHGVRQGETPYFTQWFRDQGFHVEQLPEGMHFEGAGDALFCGETLIAGYRFRSDARGHHWLGQTLGVQALPVELADPRYYHLDTCFCPIAPDTAIWHPGAFDEYGRSAIRVHVPNLIEVAEAEAVAFSCNAVALGRSIVLNVGAPLLEQALRQAGFEPHSLPLGEFLKAGGSAKCLTLRIDGEDAAAWRSRDSRGRVA